MTGSTPRRPATRPRRARRPARRWSLRAALSLWIGLAVAGWAIAVIVAYSLIRHEGELANIERAKQVAPAAGPAEPGQPKTDSTR